MLTYFLPKAWHRIYAGLLAGGALFLVALIVMRIGSLEVDLSPAFWANLLASQAVFLILGVLIWSETRFSLSRRAGLRILIAVVLGVASVALLAALKTFTGQKFVLFSTSVTLATIIVLATLERVYPAGPHPSAQRWWTTVKFCLASRLLWLPIGYFTGISLGYLSETFDLGFIDLRSLSASPVLVLLALILVSFVDDFFYYWFHRFQHESFLWHEHKLHHLDKHLSYVAVERNHWLELWLWLPIRSLPMLLLFKLDPANSGIGGLMLGALLGILHAIQHANIRLGFGRLSWLINSPQLHRVHHSQLPAHFNKNYASLFPIWDVIFGTYYHPRADEYPPTGVDGEADVETTLGAITLPFREWARMLRERRETSAETVPAE